MPKICYRHKKFSADRLDKIAKANAIIDEFQGKGFEITLRQLYYQFVTKNFIANNMREYKNLGDIINDARLAGKVDWYAIVDLTRDLEVMPSWESPSSIVEAISEQFRIDKWEDQPYRVEVWIEKDAVSNIAGPICRKLQVPFFSCRGYTSQSEMWKGAQRLKRYHNGGQVPLIIHLGDHDPSGKDMSRDILDRLNEFSGKEITVNRVALNMDQIEQYQPPPNPAKLTDSRATAYIQEFGNDSWELDALTPEVMTELIESAVLRVRDEELWTAAELKEKRGRDQLAKVSQNWDDIIARLEEEE